MEYAKQKLAGVHNLSYTFAWYLRLMKKIASYISIFGTLLLFA